MEKQPEKEKKMGRWRKKITRESGLAEEKNKGRKEKEEVREKNKEKEIILFSSLEEEISSVNIQKMYER